MIKDKLNHAEGQKTGGSNCQKGLSLRLLKTAGSRARRAHREGADKSYCNKYFMWSKYCGICASENEAIFYPLQEETYYSSFVSCYIKYTVQHFTG